jgi:hypothetical protein
MSLKSGSNRASIRSGGSQIAMGKTYADRKAEALAAKNTAVLGYDELERIKGMCSQQNEDENYMSMRNTNR